MCGHRYSPRAGAAEGATVRLDAGAGRPEGHRYGRGQFPLWALWMLWPAIWLVKGVAALSAPLLGGLAQPMALALLLMGAGVAMLLVDRAVERR